MLGNIRSIESQPATSHKYRISRLAPNELMEATAGQEWAIGLAQAGSQTRSANIEHSKRPALSMLMYATRRSLNIIIRTDDGRKSCARVTKVTGCWAKIPKANCSSKFI